MILVPLLALASAIGAMPREYVVDFKDAGGNAAAYKLTVTVATQSGTKASIEFTVLADVSAGLLRAAVRAALEDVKGIELEPVGDDILRVKAAKNEKLVCIRFNGTALQQSTKLPGYPVTTGTITLRLNPKRDEK